MDTEEIIEERTIKLNGDLSSRRYSKGEILGKGGFASCYVVTNIDTRKKYAAKIIPKSLLSRPRIKQKLMSEIKIHKALHHTNIVGFERFFEDSQNVYILLELCSNQSLKELIKQRVRLTELEAKHYTLQMIAGLEYMHGLKILHRDLKLGNIFLNHKMELKLGDLGLATRVENGELKRSVCGTPNYIAPEMLEGKKGHSYGVDIWAIGVILYTLLVGRPPFQTGDIRATYRRIRLASFTFPPNVSLSTEAMDLVSSILVTDPADRPSLEEMRRHPFLSDPDVPKILPEFTMTKQPTASSIKHFEVALDKQLKSEEVCVKKWVDYSAKYGLGYLLSNGMVGTHFNDGSKMMILGESLLYIKKRNGAEVVVNYQLSDYPKKFYKKVVLVQHFRSYLDSRANDNTVIENNNEVTSIYVKKWVRTKHAIIFRLSNKVVQVSFQDNTELLLSSRSGSVVFSAKDGSKTRYELRTERDIPDKQVAKRIKYTKEVLSKLATSKAVGTKE